MLNFFEAVPLGPTGRLGTNITLPRSDMKAMIWQPWSRETELAWARVVQQPWPEAVWMLFIPKVSYSLARGVGSGHGVSIDREGWDLQWHVVRSQAALNTFCPWTSYSVYHLCFNSSMWAPCLDVTELQHLPPEGLSGGTAITTTLTFLARDPGLASN